MANGFFSLGEMIAGGGIDREGAFLEGLDTGSKIRARQATTSNALAQARLRVDEQENREGLADAVEAMGLPREISVSIRAGVDPKQITGALLEQQEFGQRASIADIGVPFEQRQASAQAVEGKVIDPFQFGPGGDLFTRVMTPGAAPELTATGPAAIALDEARAKRALEAAELSRQRALNPDRFKASTTVNIGGAPLAEQILPGGAGTSIIPEDIDVEEAFGAEAFLKGGANAFLDFIGAGTPFEAEAQANTVLSELSARTQIVLRADVPGGRPPVIVQELLGRYAEDPRQLFRGDAKAKSNLRSTVASLKRSLQRIKDQLNSPSEKTPTRLGNLEESLFAIADLVADYEKILVSLDKTQSIESQFQERAPAATSGVTQTAAPAIQGVEIGGQIQLPGGGTATRIE